MPTELKDNQTAAPQTQTTQTTETTEPKNKSGTFKLKSKHISKFDKVIEIPNDPKEYNAYMRKEVITFAKMINKYKNELAKMYTSAKTDFQKVSKLSKDRLK